jgi:hypothetical protein
MSPSNNTNANKQSLQPKGPRAIHKAWNLKINHHHSEHMRRLRPPIDHILQKSEKTLLRHL